MENAEKIVKLAIHKGFDESIASISDANIIYVKIVNSAIDSIIINNGISTSLFVSSKKKLFFTNIQKPEIHHITKSIENAKMDIAKQVPKTDYNGIAEGPFKYKKKAIVDNKILSIDTEDATDIAEAAINSSLENGAKNVFGTLIFGYGDVDFATSKNINTKDKFTFSRLSLRVINDNISFQDVNTSRSLNSIKPEKLGLESAKILKSVNKISKIKAGVYDIIYMPSPAGLLISNVNSLACAGSIETGSPFTNKINSKVAANNISIFDDGISKNLVGSSSFDGEGYPTQKTSIISNGIFKTYLHNNSTAIKYNAKDTGNAGIASPNPSTTVIEHKRQTKDLDSLMRKVDKGILITNTWYTRFSNYFEGKFSTVPRDIAIYIEKGEPKFAIKQRQTGVTVGIRINENLIRMLENIDYSANDSKQTSSWDYGQGSYVSPSILVKNVKVSIA
jgi:PmbA protein